MLLGGVMRRIISILFLTIFSPLYIFAETLISGNIGSQTWTAAGNPYIMTGNINIPAGNTLTICQGVILQNPGNDYIDVNGVILIQGQQNFEVVISCASSTSGCRLDLCHSDGTCIINYAHFINYYSIELGANPVHISNSILNARIEGYYAANSAIIENCNFGINSYGYTCAITGCDGFDWTVINNSIDISASTQSEEWDATATGIINVQGTIKGNSIHCSAQSTYGDAYSYGIYLCSGDIMDNNISTNGGDLSEGILYCSGTIDSNYISGWGYYWKGIANCSSGIAYNVINAGGYNRYGITDCTGAIHHNYIAINGDGTNFFGMDSVSGEIYNNTIVDSRYGIANAVGIVQNSIINHCTIGLQGSFTSQYNCIFSCFTPYSGGVTPGIGDIQADPQLAGFNLTINSPCIDTGNPAAQFIDPDGTRDDMGANFFDQSGYHPENLYIQIAGNNAVLNWSPDPFANFYRIYRSTNPYSFGTQYLTELTGTTTYTDQNAAGQNYFYKVVSVHQ
jgi:hypothetical protein